MTTSKGRVVFILNRLGDFTLQPTATERILREQEIPFFKGAGFGCNCEIAQRLSMKTLRPLRSSFRDERSKLYSFQLTMGPMSWLILP